MSRQLDYGGHLWSYSLICIMTKMATNSQTPNYLLFQHYCIQEQMVSSLQLR